METANDVDTIVLTPHFDPHSESADIFTQKCRERYDGLLQQMGDRNITLILGSETFYSSVLMYYSTLTPLCICGTRYLLLEFANNMLFNQKFLTELERLIVKFDIIPIVAHTERYMHIKRHINIIKKLKQIGCIIQVNADYILRSIDSKFVKRLFKHDYIDMLASDCHDCETRPPNLKDAIALIDEKYDGYYSKKIANKYKNVREIKNK
jgi:protein-tyrosine phosphatase